MIDEKLKAKAIAKLKLKVALEDISEELDIPVSIVKEWQDNLDPRDLVALEANVNAMQTILHKSTSPEKLKDTLEQVALEVAQETSKAVAFADPLYSKSLQLCADTLCKLYSTFVVKSPGEGGNGPVNPSGTGLTIFGRNLKD